MIMKRNNCKKQRKKTFLHLLPMLKIIVTGEQRFETTLE